MRKFIIVGLIAVGAMATPSAQAARPYSQTPHAQVKHHAPIPCAVACSYWLETTPSTPGSPCPSEFPLGSYDKTIFRVKGTFSNSDLIDVWAKSTVDYDAFVCTVPAGGGTPLIIRSLANVIGDECEGLGGRSAVAVACEEAGTFSVGELREMSASQTATDFVIYSFNWSDNQAIDLLLWGSNSGGSLKNIVEVKDDSYVAGCPDAALNSVCNLLRP